MMREGGCLALSLSHLHRLMCPSCSASVIHAALWRCAFKSTMQARTGFSCLREVINKATAVPLWEPPPPRYGESQPKEILRSLQRSVGSFFDAYDCRPIIAGSGGAKQAC